MHPIPKSFYLHAGNVASKGRRWAFFFLVFCAAIYPVTHLSGQAAELFLSSNAILASPIAAQAIYKARVSLVNVLFTVSDRNKKFINNLTQQDFGVFEDGVPQQIQYFSNFSKTGDVPLTIALLVDTSGSVKDKLQLEIDTASEFLRNVLRPNKDLALLMQFSSEVELVQDFTDSVPRLEKALDTLRAGGGTSLYDAIFLAVNDKLKFEVGRKIVVILSDGEDNQSKVQKQEAIVAAQKSDVLIYGIGVKSDFGVNFGVMKEFARDTGGRFFLAKVQFNELQQAFEEIKHDLQNQYGLAYSPTNTKQDGAFRRIEVRCKNKALVVKARTGYYAPREEKPPRS